MATTDRRIPRRSFFLRMLAFGSAGTVLLAGPRPPRAKAAAPPITIPGAIADRLSNATRASFVPFIGTVFRVHLPSGAMVGLTLVSATDYHPTKPPRPSKTPMPRLRPPFILKFQGPANASLVAGTYPVDHPQLGILALFLTPVGEDSGTYEASFG